jgi:hypothetical protein
MKGKWNVDGFFPQWSLPMQSIEETLMKKKEKPMKAGFKTALVCLALALFATSARAGNPREHDGFFLRLSAGGGNADTELDAEVGPGEIELDGPAGDFNFAVGGVVTDNLAIHGTIFGWYVNEPDFEVFEEGGVEGEGELDGTMSMAAYGGGLTYYLMPVNLYFSASVGAAILNFEDSGFDDSDTGIAGDFTVGKEWWVGDGWGLGFSGGMSIHSVPHGRLDENWTGKSFTLRFSSTFN